MTIPLKFSPGNFPVETFAPSVDFRMTIERMKCDWCGNEFPTDARACVEAGIEVCAVPENSLNNAEAVDVEVSESESEELEATGECAGMGAIVCLRCQEESVEE